MHIIITLIHYVIRLLVLAIFLQALMSWFVRNPYNRFYIILNRITEPILSPFRKLFGRFIMQTGIDFTPLIAIFVLDLLRKFLIQLLYSISY